MTHPSPRTDPLHQLHYTSHKCSAMLGPYSPMLIPRSVLYTWLCICLSVLSSVSYPFPCPCPHMLPHLQAEQSLLCWGGDSNNAVLPLSVYVGGWALLVGSTLLIVMLLKSVVLMRHDRTLRTPARLMLLGWSYAPYTDDLMLSCIPSVFVLRILTALSRLFPDSSMRQILVMGPAVLWLLYLTSCRPLNSPRILTAVIFSGTVALLGGVFPPLFRAASRPVQLMLALSLLVACAVTFWLRASVVAPRVNSDIRRIVKRSAKSPSLHGRVVRQILRLINKLPLHRLRSASRKLSSAPPCMAARAAHMWLSWCSRSLQESVCAPAEGLWSYAATAVNWPARVLVRSVLRPLIGRSRLGMRIVSLIEPKSRARRDQEQLEKILDAMLNEMQGHSSSPQQILRRIDKNGDRELTRDELCRGLKSTLGIYLKDPELEVLFRKFDPAKNGVIRFSDFCMVILTKHNVIAANFTHVFTHD